MYSEDIFRPVFSLCWVPHFDRCLVFNIVFYRHVDLYRCDVFCIGVAIACNRVV